MRKFNKYDIVIYSCLFAAIICLIIGGHDYINDLTENSSVKDEVKSALNQINSSDIEENTSYSNQNTDEPEELSHYDKNSIVQKYIDSILDQIQEDDLLTYKMIKSWNDYKVINMTYERQVADDYYEYKTDIQISNLNAILPTDINEELSTDEYLVISLNVYIYNSTERNGYIVKQIDK